MHQDLQPATLSDQEIAALVPNATQPATVVKRLHAAGFKRARIVGGRVVLERVHYEAVCRGEFGRANKHEYDSPKLTLEGIA